MPKSEVSLVGHTKKALEFIAENRQVTIDEVALHLGLPVNHTRDVLFRARERGFIRKVPVTFIITPSGRKLAKAHSAERIEPGSPEADLTGIGG